LAILSKPISYKIKYNTLVCGKGGGCAPAQRSEKFIGKGMASMAGMAKYFI